MRESDLVLLGIEIATQDNAMTGDPIFVVFQDRKIYGADDETHFEWAAYDSAGDELEQEKQEELEDIYQLHGGGTHALKNVPELQAYYRCGYVITNEFVTACFTRAGAEAYVRSNGHNLKNPHIYVHSMYRNQEMIALRRWIMSKAEKVMSDRYAWEYR